MTEAEPYPQWALDLYCNGPALRQAAAIFLVTRFLPPTATEQQVLDAVETTRTCLEAEVRALCEANDVSGWHWQILINSANLAFEHYLTAMMVDAEAVPAVQLPN